MSLGHMDTTREHVKQSIRPFEGVKLDTTSFTICPKDI